MTPIITLLTSFPYLDLPKSLLGWAGWFFILGIVVFAAVRWRGFQNRFSGRRWLLVLLLVFTIPASLFVGLRLPAGSALPVPGLPLAPRSPALMFFAALAWMLAGGFLGPVSALSVGLLTGLTRGLWDTHNLFTLLEPAMLGVLFSVAVRQRYRTMLFRILSQPVVIALCLIPVYALLFISGAFFAATGSLAARLDYALTNALSSVLAVGGELLVAGVFAQVIALAFPNAWGTKQPLQPSPVERSLQTRFLFGSGAVTILLLLALLIGNWIVAGEAARQMLRERLAATAQTNAGSIPFFLETGQSLAAQFAADPRLLAASGEDLNAFLGEQIRISPFFDQLFILDQAGNLLGSYPVTDIAALRLTMEEVQGVPLAFGGVTSQVYTVAPGPGGQAGQVAFLVAISGADGQPQRLLVGRSNLASNPLTQLLVSNLRAMGSIGGTGILLDAQGRILFHPNSDQLMTEYLGQRGEQAVFYDLPAPGGTRDYVYYQPVGGTGWSIVLDVPAQQAQQLALQIAAPLSITIVILGLVALVALRLGLRVVTASLQNLASEAARISQGHLEHPLQVGGVDEVGQLRGAFEQMRLSLRARLGELNQLLIVSQGVASSLEIEDAIRPVLEAMLVHGASSVRVVLIPSSNQPPEDKPQAFSLGSPREAYAYLDVHVIDLVQSQERPVVLSSLGRVRGLELQPGLPHPASLAAVALRHETRFYGVLWAAYDQPQSFSEEDIRFLSTLAGNAALAATNARLFRSAEVGRQRLAAILASTPDPVLVTDQQNRLLLANPAARQALGVMPGVAEGQPTERVINQKELIELLQMLETEKQSAEVVMPDGRVYFATASSVIANNRPVGRVCVMRDITHFKELDALKSDFVSSVSHDLRSPLTLIRGYATMLEMIGALNEQQKGYVTKIIIGVESMSRLVNNLLDLGRIDAGVGLQIDEVALLDVLDGVISTVQLQASHKNISLGVETSRDLPVTIQADRALLQQAVYNLVENAIKYTSAGGHVTLRARARPEGVLFEVQDNGIGISAVDQPRLFEKFYRGSSREAREQRGSGLGLAIVRSVAERHGGRIWLESYIGKGSTFFLLVPHKQPVGENVKKEKKS